MSAVIEANDLKFVIFGAGHDYTLADSGRGDLQVFSHPFVPLNSLHYAGQWFFTVTDDQGNIIDAVKDDITHCSFTPALGAAFDSEGPIEVECSYHREYINGDETIVVDKTVSQIIEVVNHGTVSSSETYCDLYTDGYGYYRPQYTNTVESNIVYLGEGSPTKLSSIPWRAKGLGTAPDWFCNAGNLTDIDELAYADVSTVTIINGLFVNSDDIDLTPVSEWDISNVTDLENLFYGSDITDLTPIANWDVSNVTNFGHILHHCHYITALTGLERWDVSSATNMRQIFDSCFALSDVSAVAGWDVSNVTDFQQAFISTTALTDISPLGSWDVSSAQIFYAMFEASAITSVSALADWTCQPTDIRRMFFGTNLVTLVGLEGFDVTALTEPLRSTFAECMKLKNVNGLETWDVSNITDFQSLFDSCVWLNDVSALASWDLSSGENFRSMFVNVSDLLDLTGITWDLSSAQDMTGMFGRYHLYSSSMVGKKVYADAYYYWDYEGNRYTYSQVTSAEDPYTELFGDATAAQNWTVVGSNWGAFNTEWINTPSWN